MTNLTIFIGLLALGLIGDLYTRLSRLERRLDREAG